VTGVLAVLGLVSEAWPASANTVAALEGSWTVASATVNGAPRVDSKVLNSAWTFRAAELVVQNASGERFLIQRSQNKDSLALQLKLNEIVSALDGASNRLVNIEDLTEGELADGQAGR